MRANRKLASATTSGLRFGDNLLFVDKLYLSTLDFGKGARSANKLPTAALMVFLPGETGDCLWRGQNKKSKGALGWAPFVFTLFYRAA